MVGARDGMGENRLQFMIAYRTSLLLLLVMRQRVMRLLEVRRMGLKFPFFFKVFGLS